jgi:hypothetical protein
LNPYVVANYYTSYVTKVDKMTATIIDYCQHENIDAINGIKKLSNAQ